MSTADEDFLTQFPERDDDPPAIRQMREQIKRQAQDLATVRAEAANATPLMRENAFLKAGVDLTSPVGEMFTKAYDGELEPEAIQQAAARVGALLSRADQPTVSPGAAPITTDEIGQTRERLDLAAGEVSGPVGEPDPDPIEAGYARYQERIKNGARKEDAAAEVLDRIIDAAARGDERALYDHDRWREDQRQTIA